MAKRIQKPFCVVFKRSEAEKRAWNMGKELDAQKSEIEALKAEIEAMKSSGTKSTKSSKK